MEPNKILETERLVLQEFSIDDAEFILSFLNTPGWLEYIGDKNVRSVEDAVDYLEEGPIKSYKENGFGLWLTLLKNNNTPIGMCGLIKRESLDNIDIGLHYFPNIQNWAMDMKLHKLQLIMQNMTWELTK